MSGSVWLRADPIGSLLLDVNLDNVARVVGRQADPKPIPRADGTPPPELDPDKWVLEVGYLSGGSDPIFLGTRAEVEEARDALFNAVRGAADNRLIDLAKAIASRRPRS